MSGASVAALPPGLARLVQKDPASGCWVWTGRVDRTGRGRGYGRIGRAERAHLIVYTLLVGPIGRGRELDHLCRNRRCVNPAHLEPVTHAENMRRLQRSHCKRGHALAGKNLDKSGNGRTCRACRNERRRAARAAGKKSA